MEQKRYSNEIDRQTTFKVVAANMSDRLKEMILNVFDIQTTFQFETVFIDIIRPLHYEGRVVDIYIAGKFINEVDDTKQLQCVLKTRLSHTDDYNNLFPELDDAVEVETSSIPAPTAVIIDCSSKIAGYISEHLSGDEKTAHDAVVYNKYVMLLSNNYVYTIISLKSELSHLNSETQEIVSTTYIPPVEVNNAMRLYIEYLYGEEYMRDEEYVYDTLTEE